MVAVLKNTYRIGSIRETTERLHRAIEELIETDELHEIVGKKLSKPITISIGAIALRHKKIKNHIHALSIADDCKNAAKDNGRNCTVFYNKKGQYKIL